MENINRRQFIKTVSTSMVMSAVPIGIMDTHEPSRVNNTDLKNAIIEVLTDEMQEIVQSRILIGKMKYYMDIISENVSYAFDVINPSCYEDLAFVVACGKHHTCHEFPDEYVRRRNGLKPLMPDHPIFALDDGYGLPDTKRILIYTEQIDCLLIELVSREHVEDCKYQFVGLDDFLSYLKEKYKESLTAEEQWTIYNGIDHYFYETDLYRACCSVVNRALRKTNALKL